MQNKQPLKKLCCLSKQGDRTATLKLITIFERQVYKNSYINGKFNEDCFQELSIKLLKCIRNFTFNSYYDIFSIYKRI